jgi:hypothetical protein
LLGRLVEPGSVPTIFEVDADRPRLEHGRHRSRDVLITGLDVRGHGHVERLGRVVGQQLVRDHSVQRDVQRRVEHVRGHPQLKPGVEGAVADRAVRAGADPDRPMSIANVTSLATTE